MTDDKVCLTYKSDQSVDLYNLHELNAWFFSSCTGVKRPRSEPTQDEAENTATASKDADAAADKKAEKVPANPPAATQKTGGRKNKKGRR
mmetsp:Transcript_10707/g.19835  ORF Transcript_10707/g.19835 Transcript_10707/m.19835 type:complete len:90 (-) Transcript_10707:1767-2036(-)|eukprot:CAMPEP_0184547660 /NCGR_PEP_ID=MMETSP0199_2-20130426/5715_1 /TAXON_ID=1112570 /ORGANISM="Thraustochytrium sp., Strain LLF1b" /LENGTH=89 /DNA_ID=CAMNT_0026942179 /DNA_START=155 /DNA_END=424 /DNA_ORIENTATION=-